MYQIEVDTTDQGASERHARNLDLDCEVVDQVGPGGGWPTLRLRGGADPLRAFLAEHCGDPADGEEYFEEFAQEVPA